MQSDNITIIIIQWHKLILWNIYKIIKKTNRGWNEGGILYTLLLIGYYTIDRFNLSYAISLTVPLPEATYRPMLTIDRLIMEIYTLLVCDMRGSSHDLCVCINLLIMWGACAVSWAILLRDGRTQSVRAAKIQHTKPQ